MDIFHGLNPSQKLKCHAFISKPFETSATTLEKPTAKPKTFNFKISDLGFKMYLSRPNENRVIWAYGTTPYSIDTIGIFPILNPSQKLKYHGFKSKTF